MEKYQPLKIIESNQQTNWIHVTNDFVDFRLNNAEKVADLEDVVYMTPSAYIKIFRNSRRNATKENKLLSVVKIKYGKQVIHRQYVGVTCKNFTDDMLAITPRSWRLLSNERLCPTNKCIEVSRGNKFCYYWNHPFHATRISMRLGVISVTLSVMLFLIGLFIY